MKVLIIEDEPAAARRLGKLIIELLPGAELLPVLDSIEGSIIFIEQQPLPDLILLDIHLADGSSFEIFRHVEVSVPVIFTTAYDQYAIAAFKVNAIDYLLKPIKREALADALQRFRQRQNSQELNYQKLVEQLNPQRSIRFLIRLGQQIKLIELKEVAYAYTEERITFLMTNNGRRYPVDYSLEKLDELFPSQSYFRINRQFIIGFHAISEMIAYSKGRVKLKLTPPADHDTVVSTERSPVFKKWLNTY